MSFYSLLRYERMSKIVPQKSRKSRVVTAFLAVIREFLSKAERVFFVQKQKSGLSTEKEPVFFHSRWNTNKVCVYASDRSRWMFSYDQSHALPSPLQGAAHAYGLCNVESVVEALRRALKDQRPLVDPETLFLLSVYRVAVNGEGDEKLKSVYEKLKKEWFKGIVSCIRSSHDGFVLDRLLKPGHLSKVSETGSLVRFHKANSHEIVHDWVLLSSFLGLPPESLTGRPYFVMASPPGLILSPEGVVFPASLGEFFYRMGQMTDASAQEALKRIVLDAFEKSFN